MNTQSKPCPVTDIAMSDPLVGELFDEYGPFLQRRLSAERVKHCLGTALKAVELVDRFFPGDAKLRRTAALAGLLHDCAREIDPGGLRDTVSGTGFESLSRSCPFSDCPVLLHGPAAAVLIEKELSIHDAGLLEAVAWHSTGRDEPPTLLSLLICADLLEDGRSFAGAPSLPDPAGCGSLVELALAVQARRLEWCVGKRMRLAPQAVSAYHWYLEEMEH